MCICCILYLKLDACIVVIAFAVCAAFALFGVLSYADVEQVVPQVEHAPYLGADHEKLVVSQSQPPDKSPAVNATPSTSCLRGPVSTRIRAGRPGHYLDQYDG